MNDYPDDLARFTVEPLQPPPGAFDTVSARARQRRSRKAAAAGGVALTLVAVIGGGLARATPWVGPAGDDSLQVAGPAELPVPPTVAPESSSGPPADVPASPSSTAVPSREPSASAAASPPPPSLKPSPKPSAKPSASPTAVTLAVHPVAGVVLDSSGTAVAGVEVHVRRSSAAVWAPSATTSAEGAYSAPCDAQVLLSTWAPGSRQTAATKNLAPVALPPRGCTGRSDVLRTTMRPGAVLSGRISRYQQDSRGYLQDPTGELTMLRVASAEVPGLWVYPHVDQGDYTFVGLPASGALLRDVYEHPPFAIALAQGQPTARDWAACRACPTGVAVVYGGESQP